jgi:hypothetical protein
MNYGSEEDEQTGVCAADVIEDWENPPAGEAATPGLGGIVGRPSAEGGGGCGVERSVGSLGRA